MCVNADDEAWVRVAYRRPGGEIIAFRFSAHVEGL